MKRLNADESGAAMLVYAVLLLAFGGLMLPPLMSFVTGGVEASQMYERKTNEIYAADSGMEDALWYVKYGDLESKFASPAYDKYDYSTVWNYNLSEQLNNCDVNVTLENIWMPKDVTAPNKVVARNIIETGKLIVTGGVLEASGTPTYKIQLTYDSEPGESLDVDKIGVWLPVDFDYVEGSSNLEELIVPLSDYYSVPTVTPHCGGQAIIWDFSFVTFPDLPGANPANSPIVSEITFEFEPKQEEYNPAAIAWVETSGVSGIELSWDADIRVFEITSTAGDARVEAHAAKSELREMVLTISGDYAAAGNGLLGGNETYHDELNQESNATFTSDTEDEGRDADELPANCAIERAYLYWTGWMDWHDYDAISQSISWDEKLLEDDCSNWTQGSPPPASPIDASWTAGGDWTLDSGRFKGDSVGSGASDYLTMNSGVDLSSYSEGEITISWEQYAPTTSVDSTDCVYYYLYDNLGNWDGPFTAFCNEYPSSPFIYTINDDQYLHAGFKLKFYLQYFGGSGEYCQLDNIIIGTSDSTGCSSLKYPTADPSDANLEQLVEDCAKINRVMFAPGPSHSGTQVTVNYAEGEIRIEPSEGAAWTDTWSYACRADVTELINQWIEDTHLSGNGAGTYTLGHVVEANAAKPGYTVDFDFGTEANTGYPLGFPAPSSGAQTRHSYCYSGWSLLLIYSSPETDGHQMYLYDDMTEEAWGGDKPTGIEDPDFDGDGAPGGTISGFLIPEDIGSGDNAAMMTVFVAEGDRSISGDSFAVNGTLLTSDNSSSTNNVWDGDWTSGAHSVLGVDIDTFTVDSPLVAAGDTQADINMETHNDGFFTIYIILSFRSEIATGGAMDYIIDF
ncbi:MAG: hypothetical protein GY845_34995 [Planctomycetes bacterium]|nr:hypothetical protein [Planctomycetota bacterium]